MPQRQQRRSRGQKPAEQVKIARERIAILLNEAAKTHASRPDLSRRYYKLAKKIGMRYNVKIPSASKRRFCRYCYSYLAGGWRFKRGVASVTCGNCKKTMRYPYKPKRRAGKHATNAGL